MASAVSQPSIEAPRGVGHGANDIFASGPFYDCVSKERLGPVGDGGKWVCEVERELQKPGCIVYSLGSNMETGFEEDVLRKTKCKIFTFDYTLSEESGSTLNNISPRMQFFPYKIGTGHTPNSQHEEKSIDEIMQDLGHVRVDVLKMDIEGAEWDVLDAMLEKGDLPFNQMQLELHLTKTTLGRVLNVLSRLTENGFRVFSVEPNLYCCTGALVEYSFIKEAF